MPLEYPVTKPYTLPNLTVYFSVASAIAIAGLAALNFILQGYDVVTVLRSDPNVTDSHWWTPVAGWHSAGSCDPVSLSRQSTFRTNSSLFSYTLRGTFGSSGSNFGATPYMANPLNSCMVEAILVTYNVNRQTMKFDTLIRCTGSNLPLSLSLISSFVRNPNPYYDDIVTYYTLNKPARTGLDAAMMDDPNIVSLNASSLTNVVGILDALGSDLALSIGAALYSNTSQVARPTMISTGGTLVCPGGQNATCKAEDMKMIIPLSQTDYPNGTTIVNDGPGPVLSLCERPMLNLLTALRDAYHIDLGNIQSSNTLLNKDAFDETMEIDQALTAVSQEGPPGWKYCTMGVGCTVNMTWVQRLMSSDPNINITLPTVLPTGDAPAVVRIDYLCPSYKLKGAGSLLASVFIGTWSMYMALFGVFRFVGPMLEQRYGRGDDANNTDVSSPGYTPGAKDQGGYYDPVPPESKAPLANA